MKYKTKQTLKQIVSILLLCCVGFGAVVGISAISKKLNSDDKTIHPTFSVGSITSAGKGDSSDKSSIYTKDAFECKGLKVELDFDATVSYQAFFYDELGNYISNSATEKYDESEDLSAVIPTDAVYARLVVTPDDDEDGEIKWYEVSKYSSQLTVKVLRDQGEAVDSTDDFETTLEKTATKKEALYMGEGLYDAATRKLSESASGFHFYGTYNVTDYDELIIKISTDMIGVIPSNYPGLEYFLVYDLNAENPGAVKLTSLNYTTLYEKDGISYVSIPVSSMTEVVFTVDASSIENLAVWVR